MTLTLLAMPGNEAQANALAIRMGCAVMLPQMRRFPDGETYLRLEGAVTQNAAIVCTLDRPDAKFLPLVFAADTLRDLGAGRVGLVAPYLSYMRQDTRFQAGEAVTSRSFAHALSRSFDWMVTVDPHLHRYRSASEIYSIPVSVLHAGPLLAQWIAAHANAPVLIGPDSESVQWVSAVAAKLNAPFTVLEKVRKGDREVEVRIKDSQILETGRQAVIVDDILSSGRTMLEAVKLAKRAGAPSPICLAIHAVFAEGAEQPLSAQGARIVTADTIAHPTNAIAVAGLLAEAIRASVAA